MAAEKIQICLGDLAQKLGAQLIGDEAVQIRGVNTIQDAEAEEVCFLSSEKHVGKLKSSRAGAVLTQKPIADCPMAQLVVANVDKALIAVMTMFAPTLTRQKGIHPSAAVESDAQLDPTVSVGPGAYIGHHVKIGARTVIGPNSSIGENTIIGTDSRLDANVVVYHNCKIGNFCILQANTTIGSTGFGYSFIDGRHQLIPHNGGVILEDGVEIGANTSVDRAKFGSTVIGAGTKIDNQVQIAHNVVIGKACLLAGQVAIAGSTRLGDGVIMAGRSGTSDNLTIGNGAIVGGVSAAFDDVAPGQKVWGVPAIEMNAQMRSVAIFKKLPELAKELKNLSRRMEQLEAAKDD
ncbi:MAG: UDP-3-O-(3-hydroxymyristoyl)glucosamine N-acyltransferase [Planctomycetes bacterium]|nr:UDP-3-O-(3-hydroxymyristoyl)glucosamine N-acyltransferase [Planctomycetota bacterium]